MFTPMIERIQQRIRDNVETIFSIGEWLQMYPDCHPDLRREKLELWKDLERENEGLEKRMDGALEKWSQERTNRPMPIGEIAADVVREISKVRA